MKKALEGSVADESIEKNKKETEVAKPDGPGPGHARPVMLHRAIVGSFERFMGILIEHYAGKWPFWLSPRQVLVVPVMPAANSYVEELQQILSNEDFYCDIDISGQTMPKKILKGQQAQYNFIFGRSSCIPSPKKNCTDIFPRFSRGRRGGEVTVCEHPQSR